MDELDRDLAALAPSVDTGAARAAFDGRRSQVRRRRRVLQGLASVAVVAAAAVGVSTLMDEPSEEVVAGNRSEHPPEPTGPVEFEVLAVVPRDGDLAAVPRARLIADVEGLDLALDGTTPTRQVDFAEEVVVSMAMPHDGCRQLLELVREPGGEIRPVFEVPPVVSCSSSQDPVVHGFVVAIRRESLPNAGRLRLDEELGLPAALLELPSSLAFDVLRMEPAVDPMGSLRAAVDDDELGRLWDDIGFDGEPPAVGFDERVVVSITIPDDACPPSLAGFQNDLGVLTPLFVEPATACVDPLIPKTFVVAVDRQALASRFTLRLPRDELYGFDEQRLDVGVGSNEDPGTTSVPASEDVAFQVLRVAESVDVIGSVRSATDGESFLSVWPPLGPLGEPPVVDFDEQVVVSITIPTSSCEPELTGLQRDGGRITPTFVEPRDRGCNDILVARTYIVALDRASLEPGFTLFLPGQPIFGFGDTWSVVRLSGADPEPPCPDVEAFAEGLVDVGIDYDYTASESPAELLTGETVAFRGVLTGGFASASSSALGGRSFVAYEVEVQEVLHQGPFSEHPVPERRFVSVAYSASGADPAFYADAIAAGTPVVVVAFVDDTAPGGLSASIEGFATACPSGPLLGWVGTQGEWPSIGSLDELADALRP
jgi:hypothetical protein